MSVCAQSLQSCPSLFHTIDCSPPSSSVHGILQARILEWVAMPSSRGSSPSREWTQASCIADGFFTIEPPGKSSKMVYNYKINLSDGSFSFFSFHFSCLSYLDGRPLQVLQIITVNLYSGLTGNIWDLRAVSSSAQIPVLPAECVQTQMNFSELHFSHLWNEVNDLPWRVVVATEYERNKGKVSVLCRV